MMNPISAEVKAKLALTAPNIVGNVLSCSKQMLFSDQAQVNTVKTIRSIMLHRDGVQLRIVCSKYTPQHYTESFRPVNY